MWPLTSQNSPAIGGDRHEKSIALQDDDSNVRGQSENSGRAGERRQGQLPELTSELLLEEKRRGLPSRQGGRKAFLQRELYV